MKKSTCLAFALRLVPDPAYLCQLIVTFLDNLHPRIWMTGLETNPPNVFQYQLDQCAMCIEQSFQPTSTHKGCLIIPEKRGTYSTFTQNAYIWYWWRTWRSFKFWIRWLILLLNRIVCGSFIQSITGCISLMLLRLFRYVWGCQVSCLNAIQSRGQRMSYLKITAMIKIIWKHIFKLTFLIDQALILLQNPHFWSDLFEHLYTQKTFNFTYSIKQFNHKNTHIF